VHHVAFEKKSLEEKWREREKKKKKKKKNGTVVEY
jgi:hypothetical protein